MIPFLFKNTTMYPSLDRIQWFSVLIITPDSVEMGDGHRNGSDLCVFLK